MKMKYTLIIILFLSNEVLADLSDVMAHTHEVAIHMLNIDSNENKPVTVGDGLNCHFSKIQDAIDSNANEIRIVDKGSPYFENIKIHNSVTLKGNYLSCEDADNNIESDVKAVIDGKAIDSVINILSFGDIKYIPISHLVIQNGGDNGSGTSGSGIKIRTEAEVFVMLNHVNVVENHGFIGAGIDIGSSDSDKSVAQLFVNNSTIKNNNAEYAGGGISASTKNSKIMIAGDTFIENNHADIGGGIHTNDYSLVTVFSPVSIVNNSADVDGGGLFLNSDYNFHGEEVCVLEYCFGINFKPIKIVGNVADADNSTDDGKGGGLFLPGATKEQEVNDILFEGNKAVIGGAFFIDGYLIDRGKVTFNANRFEENRADFGVVGVVMGSSQYKSNNVRIFNSIIANNGASGQDSEYLDHLLFYIYDNTYFNLTHNTIANNKVQRYLILNQGVGVKTELSSNIIHNDARLYVGVPKKSSLHIKCNMIKNGDGLPEAGNVLIGGNPSFVNADNGEYFLKLDSDAIDFCGHSSPIYIKNDFYGLERGADNVQVDDFWGTFDLGALVYQGH